MNTRHKILNLKEDEDFIDDKNSDGDFSISKDSDLYSDFDEEEDASYLIKKDLRREFGKKTTTKKTLTKNKKANAKPKTKANISLRKSFKNSLGRKTKNINDNKENINIFNNDNDNNIKNMFKKYNKNSKSRVTTTKKTKIKKEVPPVEIQLDKTYFYQNITPNEWKEISNFISSSLTNKDLQQEQIEYFFSQYPNLSKGEHNIIKLRQILNDATQNNGSFFNFYSNNNINLSSYQKISEFIINKYYMVKPSIFEVHFFPNNTEEIHLINLISKTRSSIDIAMFTLNNVRIAEEIKNLFKRGIKLRIITDSECIKMPSSNIYSLAAEGISIKTDDSPRYHMHHKFCVIDSSVVVTGSFNWTDQAVNHNQENLLFLENKDLAKKYSDEFQRLWDDFEIEVTKEIAMFKIKEIEDKRKAIEKRKKREKEKKLIEKENKCGISNNSYEINNYTQNKGNGFFNQENLPNNNYDMYQPNNHESNEERLKDNRNSSCFIF